MNLTAPVLAAALAAAPAAASDLIAVVNKAEDTLAFVDPDRLEVVARVGVGANPHEAAAAPDGALVYVSDYAMGQGTSVSVVDPATGERVAVWDVGEAVAPHGLAVSADGSVVWASAEKSQQVIEFDAATGAVAARWETTQPASHMVVAAPDGSKLYTANIAAGSVSAVSRGDGTATVIKTGVNPEAIAMAPDGSEVWTADRAEAVVYVIDTATDTVAAEFPSGGPVPFRMAFAPSGDEVWVVNAEARQVAVFDARSRDVVATVAFDEIPTGIAFSPDGSRVAVAHTMAGTISVVDAAGRSVLGSVATGEGPDGLAWARAGG